MADRIVLDQSKIRIITTKTPKPGAEFPRPLAWWQRNVPGWLDVAIDGNGFVVLEPNGKRANGVVREVTPVLRRRYVKAAQTWMDGLVYLDFPDAAA